MRGMFAVLALLATPTFASPFDAVPVDDATLARQRGGFTLPGGLDVAIGIAIETRIDGQLALRTQVSDAATGIQVFAGGPAASAIAAPVMMAADAAPTWNVISDRSATGTKVVVFPAVTISPVSVNTGRATAPAATPLPVIEGGPGVPTEFGTVTLLRTGTGSVAQLAGQGIDIRQFIGAGTGVIVANTVDNRVIDTATSVNIDLSGVIVPANFTSTLEGVARAGGRTPF